MKKKISYIVLAILFISFTFVAFKINCNEKLGTAAQIVIDETEPDTGAINSVTAVVFDFRGYDTLGESVVLFTAICGVAAVLRRTKKVEEAKKDEK